ncbi:MAG: RimK family protein [Sumerlaeia bacterium]
MQNIIVVTQTKDWPFSVPEGVRLVAARDYLTDPSFSAAKGTRVFNLCRSLRYQSSGYYVSLLAMSRGHKVLPGIAAVQDMRFASVARVMGDDAWDEAQRSLHDIQSDKFMVSVYFGRNLAKRHDRLAARLFRLFPAPLIRGAFERDSETKEWLLKSVTPIGLGEVPTSHREFLEQAAAEFFSRKSQRTDTSHKPKPYAMAMLTNPDEDNSPSNEGALKRFERAFERAGFGVERISKDDYGRLAEFDALFIRETTAVNHHTYRFARRARAEGMVVIDDPESMVKCTNKVYLAELLARHKIATPRTMVVHAGNLDAVAERVGLPCVLKLPDSAFSLGVLKAATAEELNAKAGAMLKESDLIIAQEFFPSDYDWRVGILDRRPYYAAKYHMAKGHWQIAHHDREKGDTTYGKVEAVAIEQAPRAVVDLALKAANLIGDGLYGVDLKQVGKHAVVMEVNDNPNMDHGLEDTILKDALYDRLAAVFLERVRRAKEGWRT